MSHPIYHEITGPIIMIGFGSIGKGTLPLIERHFKFDKSQVTVIDPKDHDRKLVDERGYKFVKEAITKDNFRSILDPLLAASKGQAFIVNLSVDVSSTAMIDYAQEKNALYIDTVVEPWVGMYFDKSLTPAQRTNYALRETVLAKKEAAKGKSTAVSCCGANPGMVSWFVKKALIDIAKETGVKTAEPTTRAEWAKLMQTVGVKGIHIAERDTQVARKPKPLNVFVNTWSVEGFLSEGMQPAELGWGSHEKWLPENGRKHEQGCQSAIYLLQPGANTRVRSWCPTPGAQYGFLVTHNESISIADYFTVGTGNNAEYRPTCHYAYHPCNDAVLSLHEMFGRAALMQEEHHILGVDEIASGIDELGVLLYGHGKNAYWYGSQLSNDETKQIAPYQNATGMQVTSAVLAGMVWALDNPKMGIVEADEMDYKRCLEVQTPYLGPVKGYFTDWTPLTDRGDSFFPEDVDTSDPWQFKNILVREGAVRSSANQNATAPEAKAATKAAR